MTFGLDGTSKWSRGHYENPNRFNVATSRAIDCVIAIVGGVPDNAHTIKRYFRHFGAKWKNTLFEQNVDAEKSPILARYAWRYDRDKRESAFEIRVDDHLQTFIAAQRPQHEIRLFNQVACCGEKRLDFVLYNATTGKCCAVEVDGRDHFIEDGRSYSEEHLGRVEILRRAGWNIVHVPYHSWYHSGWLCDTNSSEFKKTIDHLQRDLKQNLLVTSA
jgi:hypothetical protein